MDDSEEAPATAKRAAGYRAADMAVDGMTLGLGTGSTVAYALERLSLRIREGLEIRGIPTSHQTAHRAHELGIPLTTLDEEPAPDLVIDGADQVDPFRRLIKGRGAALTREKCVAAAARKVVIAVDEQKLVPVLSGTVPVEVIPFAARPVMIRLQDLGCSPQIRDGVRKDGPVITDNGNFIVDCRFGTLEEPEDLECRISAIPGVVESGLFCTFTGKTTILIGGNKKLG